MPNYEIPEKLPEDFVEWANIVMGEILGSPNYKDPSKRFYGKLTTSKIRRFLSLVIDILNEERIRTQDELKPESVRQLMMARVRFAYEAARVDDVRRFVDVSGIMLYIKDIGKSREKFIAFAEYMEALVAWHRYYGGKEN